MRGRRGQSTSSTSCFLFITFALISRISDQLSTLVCNSCLFLDYIFDPGRRWRHSIAKSAIYHL